MACADPDILAIQDAIGAAEAAAAAGDRDANFGASNTWREGAEAAARARARVAKLKADLAAASTQYRRQVRAISTAASVLGIDDDTLDAIISRHTAGRTTSRTATREPERAAILAELHTKGFRPARHAAGRTRVKVPATKAAVERKITALLADAGRPSSYADSIARSRFGVDCWEWLEYKSMVKLLQMLAIDQARRGRRPSTPA